MHLALKSMNEEQKARTQKEATANGLQVPPLDLDVAIEKLRKCIQLEPHFIDAYITLAYALRVRNRMPEALQTLDRGLAQERITQSDKALAKDMENLKKTWSSSQ